jgi:hypothetical protein
MTPSNRWYIRWPRAFYAEGPVTLPFTTSSPRRVRAYLRDRFDYPKLPAGFECWPTGD